MNDTAFQIYASNLRFGRGTTAEVGWDLMELGAKRTLVFIDPHVQTTAIGDTVLEALRQAGCSYDVFNQVSAEPTDASFREAIGAASSGAFDSFLAIGGGSTIDTAKAANLYSTHPADFFDYVNAPLGKGKPVPGPLKPLIAVPTTSGTGSESTGVAIFDWVERKAKTGIAHRFLRPTLGIVDADNTRSLPAAVVAATGLDVLSHALESFTAIPFASRPRPGRPSERPTYQGTNPISDMWAVRALELVRDYLVRAYSDPTDEVAREQMLFAAAIAGIGFGNAGVHLPHAMGYPVAGMVREFRPAGYDVAHPLVPHGTSVIVHTPAVVRETALACPHRHRVAAQALGVPSNELLEAEPSRVGELLGQSVISFMKKLDMPNGLSALGYGTADLPKLVAGTLAQQRITKLSPVPADESLVEGLFRKSFRLW